MSDLVKEMRFEAQTQRNMPTGSGPAARRLSEGADRIERLETAMRAIIKASACPGYVSHSGKKRQKLEYWWVTELKEALREQ